MSVTILRYQTSSPHNLQSFINRINNVISNSSVIEVLASIFLWQLKSLAVDIILNGFQEMKESERKFNTITLSFKSNLHKQPNMTCISNDRWNNLELSDNHKFPAAGQRIR